MQKKSKVLILSTAYLPHVGGSELAIKNITERLTDFDFHIVTACFDHFDHNVSREESRDNVTIYRVGGFFSGSGLILLKVLLSLAIFSKARFLLRDRDYKLIHVFQASQAGGAAWLLKYFYPRLPVVLTVQEGKDLNAQGFLINFFRSLIIKKADRATAISGYLKDYLLSVKKDLPVDLIPNGVDLEKFSRQFSYGELAALENKLNIKPDDRVVITVSRLVYKNGLDLLVRAIGILKNKFSGKNYTLMLIGGGSERANLEHLAKELGVEDKIIFVGLVGQEDLSPYFKVSDVFVRPSRSEGLGTSFLEAMAAGVPVIGTRVGGIPDFLEDRKTGLFCVAEPEDIASQINLILENDLLREQIIKNARLVVEEKYDWDKIAEQYKILFNET